MTELEKLFEDIQNQLNNEKIKHRKLKFVNIALKFQK